jgi:F-type H+-transporting ATPase subunit delta
MVVTPGHWAAAFIGSLEDEGMDADQGLLALKALASWVTALPGAVFGSSAAEKLERLARNGIAKTGDSSGETETALRLVLLLVKKGLTQYIGRITTEAGKLLNKKRGIFLVSLEYAFPPGEDFENRLKAAIRKRMGASRIELKGILNPELIGGFRLRMGDEIIDSSVRSQLRKMPADLAAGIPGPAGGGN